VIITLDAPSPLAAWGDKVTDWARTEYEDLSPGTITRPPERMHGDREGLNDGSLIKVDSARELTILSDGTAKESEAAPVVWKPMTFSESQTVERPRVQGRQLPQTT